jgi:hypothetical protein
MRWKLALVSKRLKLVAPAIADKPDMDIYFPKQPLLFV